MRGIFNALLRHLAEADAAALLDIRGLLGKLNYSPELVDEVADAMYSYIERAYNTQMTKQVFRDMIHSQVYNVYKESMAKDGPYPRTVFGLVDTRAAEFLEKSDLFYLGKYISTPEAKSRILKFIKEAYIENGAAIGNSRKELNAFMDALGYQLELERWQARRIIDTTVSNARVMSQMVGLRQAMTKTFIIVGPDDNLTCSICKDMLGRSFSLAPELEAMDRMMAAGPEALPDVRPFLKGSFSPNDLGGMTDDQLQEAGFALPPYHPHCRHRLAAESFYDSAADVPYAVESGI